LKTYGVGAGIANLFIAPLFSSVAPTVGASGAIYGILVAFGYLFPDRPIYIYFLIPIKAKYLVILYMVLEIVFVASSESSSIAHVAHLGGAFVGFVYLLFTQKGIRKMTMFENFKRKEAPQQTRYGQGFGQGYTPPRYTEDVKDVNYVDIDKDEEDTEKTAQERIDAILDKLSEGGYQSLSEEEKRILFQESKKLR
jgi:hypothetical protein